MRLALGRAAVWNAACGLGVAATLVCALVGCGTRAFPSVASASATQSPSLVTQSPIPGYLLYTSSAWLYSFEYPSSWFNLGNSGVPNTVKYFSNQQIGSPQQLDANGIFLRVSIDTQSTHPCANSGPLRPGVSQTPIMVDGESTTEYSGAQGVSAYVTHQSWCYTFGFITTGAQDLAQHKAEIDHVLSSFKFNR